MSVPGNLTLGKKEKLCGRTPIERLFNGGGGRSLSAFPVRAVCVKTERSNGEPGIRIMVSVSKRHFKRAVMRNKIKRRLRETYRLNKDIIMQAVNNTPGKGLDIAFIWLDDKIWPTAEIELKMKNLLRRMAEKLMAQ